ncbi:MAG: hypothetical protein RTV31_03445 [Candidatus Thorarchaeota archaeon]
MNERHKKAVTLVLGVIAIVSFVAYVILPPIDEYEGWFIRQYDEVQYSVTAEINKGDTYVVDILDEYGITSGSYFKIRPTETPSATNTTEICENLLAFKGIIPIEQQQGQDWVLRNSSLPFFLPTGYWDEINETVNHAIGINLVFEWWGDMTITTSINSTEFGTLEYMLAWERLNGVLQGMTINATSQNGWDFIRLSLSSQRFAYDFDISYHLQRFSKDIPLQIFVFGTISPVFAVLVLWRLEIRERARSSNFYGP